MALSWTASASATSYNVKSATTSGGPYTTITNVTATSFVNTGLANGTTYYYVVSAMNPYGESTNSSEVNATPAALPPVAPTGLTASPGNALVSLSWTASLGATSYNVKSATMSGGPYNTITNVTATSIYDTSVANGTTYYYVVSAVDANGESANSSEATATPSPHHLLSILSSTWARISRRRPCRLFRLSMFSRSFNLCPTRSLGQ